MSIEGQANLLPINNFNASSTTDLYANWIDLPDGANGKTANYTFVIINATTGEHIQNITGSVTINNNQAEAVKYYQSLSVANDNTYNCYITFVTSDNTYSAKSNIVTFTCNSSANLYKFTAVNDATYPTCFKYSYAQAYITYGGSVKVDAYQFKLYNYNKTILYQTSDIEYMSAPSLSIVAGDVSHRFYNLPDITTTIPLGKNYTVECILYLNDNTTITFFTLVSTGTATLLQYDITAEDECTDGYTQISAADMYVPMQYYLDYSTIPAVRKIGMPKFENMSLYKYTNNEYDTILVANVDDDDLTYIKPLLYDTNIPVYKINVNSLTPDEDISANVDWGGYTLSTITLEYENMQSYEWWHGSYILNGVTYNVIIYHYFDADAIPDDYALAGITTLDYIAKTEVSIKFTDNSNVIYVPAKLSTNIIDYTAQDDVGANYILSLDNRCIIANTNVNNPIVPNYDYVFITDKYNTYKLKANVEYGDTIANRQKGVFATLNSKYPTIVANGISNYQTGSVTALFLEEEFYTDRDVGTQTGQEFITFLTNDNIKILKDWNGNMWVCQITDLPTISYINEMGMSLVQVQFSWTEVANVYDEKSMTKVGWYNQ